MSWKEKGLVISTNLNLVISAKFKRTFVFPHTNDYKEGDKITLLFSNSGKVSIQDSEHLSYTLPTKQMEVQEVDYSTLDSIE